VAGDEALLDRLGAVFLDSYFVVDRNRRIVRFNEHFVQLVGFRAAQRRQVPGRQCFDLLKLEICRERCIALACLEKNAPVRMSEIKGSTPDGRALVLELSAVPMRDETGHISGVFVTHRDVTDERNLKERSVEDAQQAKVQRETLLKIIQEKDEEIARLRGWQPT
jgi:PAS domain S-box-containing protein